MANLNREYVFEIQDFKTYIYAVQHSQSKHWRWAAWTIDGREVNGILLSDKIDTLRNVLKQILGEESNVESTILALNTIKHLLSKGEVIDLELIPVKVGCYRHGGFAATNPKTLKLLRDLMSQALNM